MAEYEIDPDMSFTDNRIYPESSHIQLYLQALCLVYPTFYELSQLMKKGPMNYLSNSIMDWCHIIIGYLNVYM